MASTTRVSSRITINTSRLNELTRAQYDTLAMTADALLTDLQQSNTMPFNTGNLQNDSTFVDDGQKQQGRVSIVSSTPYARRLYFHPEYNFRRTFNGNAGGKWLEPYISGSKKDKARQIFGQLYARNAGL